MPPKTDNVAPAVTASVALALSSVSTLTDSSVETVTVSGRTTSDRGIALAVGTPCDQSAAVPQSPSCRRSRCA